MSHTFTDENLLTWEAFASSGNFGLATRPRVVSNCLSDPNTPPRYVERSGDEADGSLKRTLRRYSMFCICSRICSIRSFSSIETCVTDMSAALEPNVFASRFNSCMRKSSRLPTAPP